MPWEAALFKYLDREILKMVITNNMAAVGAERIYNLNVKERVKNTEKLSSGYRINRAADDAAGLQISEKMREQIRGLNQGTENAKNGISWVQTGDGALGEIHDIMHRMKELAIQSLNDTNTAEDRAALQSEFDALQSEIDRISTDAKFNQKNIFSEHEPEYYQIEGNRYWQQGNLHSIDSSMNTLTIQYREDENSPVSEVTITVPEGVYTTQELVDEIDDALVASGVSEAGMLFEYTDEGTCNLNYEGGKKIEGISGGMSYLINDIYTGGSVGALIGTTIFYTEDSELEIVTGKNDNMSFEIQGFDGSVKNKSITIPQGNYNRQQILDILNHNLSDTTVRAVKYSTGIKLMSDDSVITGFKGNMFKIERKGEGVYSSVFYDNVMYGNASTFAADFVGGAVIPSGERDEEHNHYEIDAGNNTLTLAVNGGNSISLTIKNGDYTVDEMSKELNRLFKDNNIGATAEEYISGNFRGLKITSSLKGIESEVSIDKNSSAYNTLFVNRSYISFTSNAVLDNEKVADKIPVMTGGKNFNSTTLPLVINSDNDQFLLKLNGTNYTIKLSGGTYNTANDIKNELDKQLNGSGAKAGYKDKLDVSVDSQGRIVLKGREGSGLTSVDVAAYQTDKGYRELFVGENVSYKTTTVSNSGTSKTPAKITLNTPVSNPAVIDSSNNKLTVNVNGTNKTVTIPTGNSVTHKDIIDSINKQLESQTITTTNTFSNFNKSGSEDTRVVTALGNGSTNTVSKSYSATGSSTQIQGAAGSKDNVPAKVAIDVALPAATNITDKNNSMTLTMGNKPPVTKTIILDNGSYSATALKNQLQTQIDKAFGNGVGGAVVTLSGSKLVLTSRVKKDNKGNIVTDGATTEIKFDTNSSSFIRELHTNRTAAEAVSGSNLASSIKIDSGSRGFSFQFADDNGSRTVSLNLTEGTYTPATLVKEINAQLAAKKVAVTASVSNGKLKLASVGKGSDYKISYSTANGGGSAQVLFGQLDSATAATAVADCDIQPSITIDSATNGFSMTVNGKQVDLTLDAGTYNRTQFVGMLNNKLKGSGVTVKLEVNKLKYTTDMKGKNAGLSMSYSSGGTSMFQIYGETTVTTQGVKASFDKDNKLVLTGTQNGGSLSVRADGGGEFQKNEKVVEDIKQTAQSGYISTKHSSIDGADITEPVTIDKWNKGLKFVYSENGTSKDINIALSEKTYNFAELNKELSDKLEAAAGTGKFDVEVTSSGVNITCKGMGSNYSMSSFSGGFYDKVLCSGKEYNSTQTTKTNKGGQKVDSAFTIGRRDINHGSVTIEKGINDEFTFDLTYGNNSHPITISLDAGTYNGKKLVKEMQEKICEELKAMGLSDDLIEVGIGGVSTGVAGSNDNNALCLKLSKDAVLPQEGEYIIDGVRGSAAFYVFYQSEGKMVSAYIQGSKDISEGVKITDKNNELSFEVDGTEYSVLLDEGSYSADGLVDHINDKMTDAGISVAAKLEGKNLKIAHKQFGNHTIDHVTGNAKSTLFFQENSGDGKPDDIKLQLSGNAGDESKGLNKDNEAYGRDYLSIERPVVNTAFLGINSITISRPKYANKALGRLEKALNKLSDTRSMFGSVQNRLEHAIANNSNTEENTTAAESLIRDTEMADEMVSYSKNSILQQAAQAMIAQANSNFQGVAALLQ